MRRAEPAQFVYPGAELAPPPVVKLRLDGAAKRAVETGRSRLAVTAAAVTLAFAGIAMRLVGLVVQAEPPAAISAAAVVPGQERVVPRADIIDRNGILLATSLPTMHLAVRPPRVLDADQAVARLTARFPDLDPDRTRRVITADTPYAVVKWHLTPQEAYSVNRMGIPGVELEQAVARVYPQGSLFAHLVGTTDVDGSGTSGIERGMNEALNSRRRPLRLSLDARVQHQVHTVLGSAVETFAAHRAAAVVLDARNGEIVSLVSLPDFDPNVPSRIPSDTRFALATKARIETGSVFKLFNTAMALDAGVVTLRDEIDTRQPLRVASHTIRDTHGPNAVVDVAEVLVRSSNIGSATIALRMGADVQRAYLDRFHLTARIDLPIPETADPRMPGTIRPSNVATIAFGHGIAVSPLHVAAGAVAVVNGGIWYQPTLIAHATGEEPDGMRAIRTETSEAMRDLMRQVVLRGTGRNAAVLGYDVGGKTGTAEKWVDGGYSSDHVMTSFVAAFPMHSPRYVLVVTLDEPQGIAATHYRNEAGHNAAPTAGGIIERIAPLLGVTPYVPHLPQPKPDVLVSAALGAER